MKKVDALTFKSMPQHKRGVIFMMLCEAYEDLLHINCDFLAKCKIEWKQYDNDVFDYPDTVGASGFITYLGTDIIGFASWDPRQHPIGIIGHSCILPRFRRYGYGKRQIKEVLKRLRALGFTKVKTTTGDHPSFIPAQKMYLSCGFHKTRRFTDSKNRNFSLIEFEKELSDHAEA